MKTFKPICHKAIKPDKINEFFVFGERNSGTNFIDALLRGNFEALAHSQGDRRGKEGFIHGWKHGFPTMMGASDALLTVCVVRHPEDWAQSMYERPWHLKKELQKQSFSDFLRTPWDSIIDEKNFGIRNSKNPLAYAPLQWDRHPITGQIFENLMKMRNVKTAAYLGLMNRYANCMIVRYEDVAKNTEEFVNFISKEFKLAQAARFKSVDQEKGRKDAPRFTPKLRDAISSEDHSYIWAQLEMEQEARLGYRPK